MTRPYDSIKDRCVDIVNDILASGEVPFEEEAQFKFRLCIEEAVDNVISYAYDGEDGWLEVTVSRSQDSREIILRFRDGGIAFNPLEAQEPDFSIPITERRPGGLGIHFIKKMADEVRYERTDGCNILTLTRKLPLSHLSQSQLGIWYASQNQEEGICNYQIPFLYHLPDTVDIDRLKQALDSFIKAHPYILSRIIMEDGEPRTIPGPFREVTVQETADIDGCRFGEPADLLKGPLFRMELYRTPEGNYLYMDFHHIIFDGTSFTVLQNDIHELYADNSVRCESISGSTIAEEEWDLRNTDEWKKQREWYLTEFQAAQDVNSEPVKCDTGKPSGALETDFHLSVRSETVKSLCDKYGVKKSVVFTAAWAKVLANYSAEDKAFFCTIHHGRTDASRHSITMMVRTLPVYTDMPGGNKVAEWLHTLSDRQEGARSRTVYSFSDIHQDLGLRGDILFAWQGNLPVADSPLRIGDDLIPCRDLRTPRPGVTLDAQLFQDAGGYVLRIGYDTGSYTPELVAGMAESFSAVLESMVTAEFIRDLDAASADQLQWLNRQNPVHVTGQFIPVVDLFRANAAAGPDSECCVFEDRRYTYAQMDAITDDLACRISEAVGDTDDLPVVSFIAPRSEWMMIMPLAIAKTGFTYQPLDASYPRERLEFMVNDAKSRLVVCTPAFSGTVSVPELIVTEPRTGRIFPKTAIKPDDTFVLLYTSGTTGTPKGVCLMQSNFFYLCSSAISVLRYTSTSRVASYASYGFDAYQMDLWSAITNGASLHILSEEIRFDLDAIHQYFIREGITHSAMTTQVGTQLALNYPDIPTMEMLGMGGEKMVSMNPPSYPMFNLYGPTENTVFITFYQVRKYESNIPIGRPTPCTHIYIVNKDGKRVPVGAAGELWAAGDQIGKGYLGLPDKTAAVFIPNPFEDGPFGTIYRTGDIVRYREDGEIEFVGRKDGQVKIRGFRIELKEVEGVIRDFPGIREATVHPFDLEDGGKAIAAYIVADTHVDINALNAFIKESKPAYMVPAVTMQLESIPLNVNGKVDFRKLPKPEIQSTESQDTVAAPLNVLEEELHELISRIIGCPGFGISTPLSQLGLTSISGLKLSAQLFKKYGITVSMKDLTGTETLQSIENRILKNLLEEKPAKTAEEKDDKKTGITEAPLTNAQTGVYLECLKNPDSTVYNVPQLIRFPEGTGSERIKSALTAVMKAHPAFFVRMDDSVNPPRQITDTAAEPQITISQTPAEEFGKTFVKPFELSRGPLYRAVISGDDLLLDAHHLIIDGSSVSIIIHQMCDLLDGKEIEPEKCSYFEHAVREQNADSSEAEKFFTESLSSVDGGTSFPADLHGDELSGRQAEAVHRADHESVVKYARTHGITPAAVYLTALQYLAARYSGTGDVCICSVSSGRGDMDTAGTTGMFVNTIALSAHIADGSVSELIQQSAGRFRKALEHENYPFARISDKFGITPEIMFVYQVGLIDRFDTQNGEVKVSSLELSAPKCKVCLLVEERDGQIYLVAQYNDALYSADMMSRMLDSLAHCIGTMISSPEMPVHRLSIVSDSQRKELELMHSGPVVPMPVRLFHKGIERWKGSRTAVIATDATLTYDEFDALGNRIANALISRGLRRGQAVIVLLPRRSTTIGCIFGILKAGGAFIPCDPEYPAERIRLIAEDSGAPFVVTVSALAGDYPGRGICIDELLSCENCDNPELDIVPEDSAYMIYTSGSTGRPKGVRVSHGNITTCFTITEENPFHAITSRCERLCDVFTISFDAFIFEFGLALFNGRTLIFSDENESKDPVALAGLLKRTGADYMGGTSSRWLQYLELPELAECISHFKAVLQGGEKFSETLLERFRKMNPDMAVLNGYGPTEISINCNCCNLQNATWLTVGKPAPNYTEWVLDADLNELPVGVTGELCVGGPGVTQGYNNLPELTAQKFITYGGMRAFRTGDYARWHSDGQIEILGRTDNQVKLRGLRIELGEVESAISKVEGVRNVLVKICKIGGYDHLSAYFTADRKIDVNEMKKTIGATLTAYMVPDAYLQMEAFPITPNGKVDFRHLPEPALILSDREYVTPTGADERFFADTFAQILGVEKVGATDSFFELGGTSLLVMKVVIMAQHSGYSVTYSDVFANPTPRLLASLVSKGDAAKEDPDADIRDFDYAAIDRILSGNTLDTFIADNNVRPLGSVLLTGATGFLGMHIFNCLLDRYPESEIHCILRSKRGIAPEERLRQMMFYYFERDISREIGRRVFVHEGDVTEPVGIGYHIDTVINCAALVKHFAKGTEIEDVNVGGVRNCIEYCLKAKARLIQISTYSVGGASVNGKPGISAFDETMLFKGQRIANQYVHSKLMGERLVLEAVAQKGLDAKIMRVGNLSARSADGEFQINVRANSFMGRLKIYQMLGALPYSAYSSPVEFSPIDQTADAICLLAQTSSALTVFHPYNSHYQMLGDVLHEMSVIGRTVRLVEDTEFGEILEKAKQDEGLQEKLSSLLAYESHSGKDIIAVIPPDNRSTLQILLRLGFRWDTVSWNYIDRFLHQIDGLKFFDTGR